MAREVIIRILAEQPVEPSADAGSDSTPSGNAPTPSANREKKKKAKNEEGTVEKLAKVYSMNQMAESILSNAEYYAGKYATNAENYKASDLIGNARSTINSFKSMWMTAASGFKAAGPIGAAVALSVGAAKQVVEYQKTYQQEAEKIVQNAYGNYFYGTRAGLVAGGHGTEN